MITFELGFRRFNFCVAAVAIHQCHVLLGLDSREILF